MSIPVISFADQLSLVPIVQQVIGIFTILTNCAKIIHDLSQCIFLKISLLNRDKKITSKISLVTEQHIHDFKNGKISDSFINWIDQLSQQLKITPEEAKRHLAERLDIQETLFTYQRNIFQHAKYIGIGGIRLMPLVGSIYSFYQIKAAQKLVFTPL